MAVGELTAEELQNRAWQNAVNDFVCQFSRYIEGTGSGQGIDSATPGQMLSSNSVSATILPEPVKVGGHVWIDKNANGVWESGESVADLCGDAIVEKLLDCIEVRLNSFEGTSSSASGTTSYSKPSGWDANYTFDGPGFRRSQGRRNRGPALQRHGPEQPSQSCLAEGKRAQDVQPCRYHPGNRRRDRAGSPPLEAEIRASKPAIPVIQTRCFPAAPMRMRP